MKPYVVVAFVLSAAGAAGAGLALGTVAKAPGPSSVLRVALRPPAAIRRPPASASVGRRTAPRAFHPEVSDAVAASEAVVKGGMALSGASALLASAKAAAGAGAAAAAQQAQQSPGWLKPWTDVLEQVLAKTESSLENAGVPYSYGFSIILLTLFVKTISYPLTKQQVESQIKMKRLQPRLKDIKERYERSPEIIERETQVLYEENEVNPSASLFPSLATIPIFLGLFYSLRNVASEGLLDNEGFFFIPTLGGPTTFADRQAGISLKWLYPFVDGAPPIGWDEASRYLVLPVLLVIAQIASSSILNSLNEMQEEEEDMEDDVVMLWEEQAREAAKKSGVPCSEDDDDAEDEENTEDGEKKKKKDDPKLIAQIIKYALPLVVGYFSLNVPSGLALYYLSNTIISSLQQLYLRNLGGAELDELDTGEIPPGYGIRTGEPVSEDDGVVDLDEYVPDWYQKVADGDDMAWPIYDNIAKMEGIPKEEGLYAQMKMPKYNRWARQIPYSEFDQVLEEVGPPPENPPEPYPGIEDLLSDGRPSDWDEFFQDPDFRI